jgi:hypothetical protein
VEPLNGSGAEPRSLVFPVVAIAGADGCGGGGAGGFLELEDIGAFPLEARGVGAGGRSLGVGARIDSGVRQGGVSTNSPGSEVD